MEIERNEEKKIFSVWLTEAESQDQDLQRRLKSMYPKRKKEKYLVLFITPALHLDKPTGDAYNKYKKLRLCAGEDSL